MKLNIKATIFAMVRN